jgi:hypothetical protein
VGVFQKPYAPENPPFRLPARYRTPTGGGDFQAGKPVDRPAGPALR